MVKHFLALVGVAGGLLLGTSAAQAQATLGSSPYTETFDNLASGLPTGFSVYTNASATSLGTAPTAALLLLTPSAAVGTTGTPAATATTWNGTSAGFKSFASATGLNSPATAAAQAAAPNRALGVRQTGSFGDNASTATPPTGAGPAFVFQVANTLGKTDFALRFRLQSLDSTIAASTGRTTTWQVDYGTGTTPTSFTRVGTTATTGPFFANNLVTASFGGVLDNLAGPVWIRIVAPANTTGSGNRPSSAIDDFQLSWNANASAPLLTVAPATLDLGKQPLNAPSAAQTYLLTGANLTADATVSTAAPFSVSKDGTTYATSVTYTAAELAAGAKTVSVRFTPTTLGVVSGPVSGTITNASAGATSRTVAVTGSGIDPTQTVYDFSTCTGTTTLSDGWTQYSVTGAQTWACTTFGRDPQNPTSTAASPYGVQMNGYASGNVANEDWLISPALNLGSTNFPVFQFWSRTAFSGPALKLRISTNYSGTGAPSAATWTDLNVPFPAASSDTWTQSVPVNLSAYKSAGVYVAFVYTSTTAAAARWTLDDITLTNASAAPAPSLAASTQLLPFGYQAAGTTGTRTFVITASDLTGNATLTSSNAAFTLSKDGSTFAPTLTYTPAEASLSTGSRIVTVRFGPGAASTSYAGTIAVATPGAASRSVAVSGNSYDVAKTLEVVNYNIEWFGSTGAGLGPTDKALQQANVTTMLKGLAADVYVLEEVVDTTRLHNAVADLAAAQGVPYGIRVSDFGTAADDPTSPNWAGDQKVTFVYRKDVVKPVAFAGLLRCTQAQACPAYADWASGRFPFLMTADVTLDGTTRRVNFVGIHAKANATATSPNDYARRKEGADLLKALLDASYAGQNTLILGDYNDVLNGTIATGVTPAVSSYSSFLNDASYAALTLPLANAGAQSTVSYATVIDNVIASQPMAGYYLAGTTAVRTDLADGIADYGNTTSDHYPVYSRYALTQQALAAKSAATARLGLYPNPSSGAVRFEVPETGSSLGLQVLTLDGRLMLQATGSVEQLNQQLSQRVPALGSGLYLLRVTGQQQTYVDRFEKL